MFNFSRRLFQHRVFKNIGYLTLGNVFGQLLALFGAFYIPRLLGLEHYGIYNTVLAYVALFTVFTFEGLNKVVIRETAKELEKSNVILEATVGVRNLSSLFAVGLALTALVFVDYEPIVKNYIVIFSFSLLFSGAQGTINTIFQAHERMQILAVVASLRQLLRVPIAILLLKIGYGVLALIYLQLAIHLISIILTYQYSKGIVRFRFFSAIKFSKKYLFPGLRFTLLELLGVLSTKVDLFMLSMLTTPQNVGIYALASNLVNKGLILRGPISRSLFPFYTKKYQTSTPSLSNLLKHSALIVVPFLIFLMPVIFLIKPIIINLVGKEFAESASIFIVLVFYLVFNFGVIPWGMAIQTTNNEVYSIYTGFTCTVLNISLNLLFFYKFGIIGIAYSTLIVELVRVLISITIVKTAVIKAN